jgi:hypothetical protein
MKIAEMLRRIPWERWEKILKDEPEEVLYVDVVSKISIWDICSDYGYARAK